MSSSPIQFHKICIEQCEATEGIRERFGLHPHRLTETEQREQVPIRCKGHERRYPISVACE